MRRAPVALGLLLCAACAAPSRIDVERVTAVRGDGPRVLAVLAHPDDESAFAATLYKIATHLGGACDAVVVTNGEGGFKYSTLAEPLYGLELSDEATGRRHLPAIRRAEMLEGARILGLREVWFLGQTDHRYTQNADEVLGADADVWDVAFVERTLERLLARGGYDFVFTLVPSAATHGHHKAATILALRAAARLPARKRPVVLAGGGADEPDAPRAPPLSGHPLTATSDEVFVFDRTQPLGHRGRLDYRIVVNWLIAAHKSQGTMQLAVNGSRYERFFLYELNGPGAAAKARALFEALREEQFPVRDYGASAGTNAR